VDKVLCCTVLHCEKSVYVLYCMCTALQCTALHSMQGREESLRQIDPERRRDGAGLGLGWPSCVGGGQSVLIAIACSDFAAGLLLLPKPQEKAAMATAAATAAATCIPLKTSIHLTRVVSDLSAVAGAS